MNLKVMEERQERYMENHYPVSCADNTEANAKKANNLIVPKH